MAIRDATPDDADGIAQVVIAASLLAFEDLLAPDQLAHVAEAERETGEWQLRLAEPWDNVVLVAEHDGRILGVAAWIVPRGPSLRTARDGHLTHLYVRPSAQGAGLGRRLLGCAEDVLRAIGGETARLALHEGNVWTAALLASAGWTRERDSPADVLPDRGWTRTL